LGREVVDVVGPTDDGLGAGLSDELGCDKVDFDVLVDGTPLMVTVKC